MSKKHKLHKKNIAAIELKPVESKTNTQSLSNSLSTISSDHLIRFDKKTRIFLLLLIGFYFILSISKIHTSNIANWDTFLGKQESESVIAGKPRFIRMDEWMVTTPAVMGQYELGLPIKNPADGGGNAPIVFGMPTKDISTILRPSTWSYFIFDIERAFAFSWNFTIFFFLISMFLVFMLLTKNKFWLSVVGTFFIFFSSGIQWWTYSIATPMTYLNGMLISFLYLLFAKQIRTLIFASLILIISIFSFISFLYPAFQVPLIYLYFLVLIGYLLKEKKFALIKDKWQIKIALSVVSLILLGFILFHYYSIAKDTFSMMMNTVYPGKRSSVGGNLIEGKFFADFFSLFMTDTHVPTQWQNICEVSAGLMVFPIIFYSLVYYFFKYKKTDTLLLTISVFVLIAMAYVLIGFPEKLSKLSLFSMSTDYRVLPVLGVGNCILLICYLGSDRLVIKKENFSWIESGVLAVAIFVFIQIVNTHINKSTEGFFTSQETSIVTVLIMAAYLLIRFKDYRFVRPSLYTLLLILTVSNIGANPITRGLAPVLESPLTEATKEIYKTDPDYGWAVFGDSRLTHLLKANGINVFNGVKYVPPIEEMRILDPKKLNDTIYNRYAWITMAANISENDTVVFRQTYNDSYVIYIDPCSPRLKQLKVKYFVFDHKPQEAEIRCMTKITEIAGVLIYKRNNK